MTTMQDVLDWINQLNYSTQPLSAERVVTALLVTMVLAVMIYGFYRLTFKGVVYSQSYNIALLMTAMVTTLIILPITSNILLALGMVGALSIIRFRTPIKDPMDLVFMFWAIAVGITCGAGFYMVSLIGSPIIGVFIVAVSYIGRIPGAEPYILVVHYKPEADEEVRKALPSHRLRSRTVSDSGVELIIEVRLKAEETLKVDRLREIAGVKDAALVSYSGDYLS